VTAPYVLEPTWPGDPADIRDEADDREVTTNGTLHAGMVWDLRRDTVDLGDGQSVTREYVAHPGAVGVLALDDDDRVLLIRQYRHPVAMSLWEPVAGLLDVDDEDPRTAAARELVEEAGLVAGAWQVLVDLESSPGGSSETLRCYLARDLAPAPGGRPPGDGEERDLPLVWLPLDDAVAAVFDGRISSPLTVSGILAAAQSRSLGWRTLRPADAPWPQRERVLDAGRTHRPRR
jgi:ADP-ribose pyrophosphatase